MFEIVPAAELSLGEQAQILNRGFADYIAGWSDVDANSLSQFLSRQGADLFLSRFVRVGAEVAGVGYITMTANIPRLATMAIAPEFRGGGAAQHLLESLVRGAQERGDAAMMLEVIEQNPRAHTFYLRNGFGELGRLLGWRRPAAVPSELREKGSVSQIPILDALRLPNADEYPSAPWPVSRHAIAKVPGAVAFTRGGCCVILSFPAAQLIRVHDLFSSSGDDDALRATLAAVIAHFPDDEFFAPPVLPETIGFRIFEPLGFKREPLSQLLMRRDL